MKMIVRLETGGQRQAGLGKALPHSCPSEAFDTLRPHRAGLGAAQPGQTLLDSGSKVLAGKRKALKTLCCGTQTCLRAWAACVTGSCPGCSAD